MEKRVVKEVFYAETGDVFARNYACSLREASAREWGVKLQDLDASFARGEWDEESGVFTVTRSLSLD